MTGSERKALGYVGFWGAVILILGGLSLSFDIYQASVQSALYRREGVDVSTFEVWMGAKPAERSIIIK